MNDLEIRLYKRKNEKGIEEIYMTDPETLFGNFGEISLEKFTREIEELKKCSELLRIVKETYFVPLMEICKRSEKDKKEEHQMAKAYLEAMGFELEEEILENKKYVLPEKEIERIKKAFRERRNKISPEQRKIFEDYYLRYEIKNNCIKVSPKNRRGIISLSLSTSKSKYNNATENNLSLLLKLCNEQHIKYNSPCRGLF